MSTAASLVREVAVVAVPVTVPVISPTNAVAVTIPTSRFGVPLKLDAVVAVQPSYVLCCCKTGPLALYSKRPSVLRQNTQNYLLSHLKLSVSCAAKSY